jgi:hypothetical protein
MKDLKLNTGKSAGAERERWSTPQVTRLGTVGEIVRTGGSKASLPLDGDGRKPRGLG